MSINYVNLTLDLYDGAGDPVETGTVTLAPNATVMDSSDHIVVTQKPITVHLFGNPLPVVQIAATDNGALQPSGWGWLIQPQFPGAPPGEVYELLFSNGSQQYLSDLIPAVEGPVITTYATAAALAAEAARAEAAEAGFVSSASPHLTGTPTAPTASAGTNSTQLATTAYADTAVAAEASRATTAEGLKLAKASNLSDLASAGTARTNLGLGTAATLASSAVAQTASNLSDLASASTARTNLGLGTAATQASSAFDAAGAATAAQAAAIAASLPTLATAAASSAATLAVNTVTQVTAASNLTMTLPTPVAGALIVVERESASAGTVTVSGNIRGSAGTVVLSLASESEMFLGTASTWDPVAGHKTLGSLDARYAGKASVTEAVYYVSAAATASDSNDGLSWGTAKATIAGAITAIGTTSGATNPATIQLGSGTWALTSAQVITGVTGFIINGLGTEFTKLSGADAAAIISFVNCYRCTISNLSLTGSPSGTGWGIEQSQNLSGTGVSSRLLVSNVSFGQSGTSTLAYGIRWTLYGGIATNDANNDQAVLDNCKWNNVAVPLSVEHSNSLLHRINSPHFNNCGAGLAFQGGSATVSSPVFVGGTGWMLDFQAAAGNFATHGADYYHPTTVLGLQSEVSTMGLARSNASASPQTFYTASPLHLKIIGGDAHLGSGVSNVVVDWENTTSSFLTLEGLSIIAANPAAFNATSASSAVTLADCMLSMSAITCAGPLSMRGITYPAGASTTISGNPIDYTPAASPAKAIALTDASSIAVNAALGTYFRVTLGGSRTLANPTNAADGRVIILEVIQDGTGSRTLAYDTNYAFSAGLPSPTLSTSAGARDFIGFKYNGTAGKWYCLAFENGF